MPFRRFFISVVALLIVGCTTTSKSYKNNDPLAPEDLSAFRALAEEHMACLGEQTATFIQGSNAVAFLTRHISSMCEPLLAKLNKEIQARGYSPTYASGWVKGSREHGEKVTGSFILREKAKATK